MNLQVICKEQFTSSLQLNEWDAKAGEKETHLSTRQAPSTVKSRVQVHAVWLGTVDGILHNQNQAQCYKPSNSQYCFSNHHYRAPQNADIS